MKGVRLGRDFKVAGGKVVKDHKAIEARKPVCARGASRKKVKVASRKKSDR